MTIMEPIKDEDLEQIPRISLNPKERLMRFLLPKSHFKPTVLTLDNPSDTELNDDPQKPKSFKEKFNFKRFFNAIDPESSHYLLWLAFVALIYVSNIFSITIRYTYLNEEVNGDNNLKFDDIKNFSREIDFNISNFTKLEIVSANSHVKKHVWFLFDYLFDFVFLLDMFAVQTRIMFLNEGLWVSQLKQTSLNYYKSNKFIVSYILVLKLFKIV